MTDETIRTRTLKSVRSNLKTYVVGAVGVISTIVGTSFGYGQRVERGSGDHEAIVKLDNTIKENNRHQDVRADAASAQISALQIQVAGLTATVNAVKEDFEFARSHAGDRVNSGKRK